MTSPVIVQPVPHSGARPGVRTGHTTRSPAPAGGLGQGDVDRAVSLDMKHLWGKEHELLREVEGS